MPVLTVALAALLKCATESFLDSPVTLSPFYLAVIATVWVAGTRPAVFAAILGYPVFDFLVLPPVDAFTIVRTPGDSFAWLTYYVLISSSIIFFGHRVRLSQAAAEVERNTSLSRQSALEEEIRARLQVEEQLGRAKEKLEETNRLLEDTVERRTAKLKESVVELRSLSYSLSHDMRTPLRTMAGYSEALLEDYREKLTAEGVLYLERIRASAQRLDHLIQDVLTYTRVLQEDLPLSRIDLEPLIESILREYSEFAPGQATITIEHPLPPVWAHRASLHQVFFNLLSNAVKFVAPSVKPDVRIRAEIRGDHARIWVEDNGIGIDPDHFERVFDIFGRIHPERLFSGTGIGLAIVKKAVERMGGQVGLTSQRGEGSRFWITLPLADGQGLQNSPGGG